MKFRFIILISLYTTSCSSNEREVCSIEKSQDLSFSIVDTLSLNLNTDLSFSAYANLKSENDSLYFQSDLDKKVFVVSLKDEQVSRDVSYPNGFPKIIDFYIGSSNYFLTDYPYKLMETENSGRIKKNIFSSETGLHVRNWPFCGDMLAINEKEKTMNLLLFTDQEENADKDFIKKCNLNGQIIDKYGELPDASKDELFPLFYSPSKISVNNRSILGFGYEHVLHSYDKALEEEIHCAQSNYIKSEIKGLNLDREIEFQDEANFIIQSPFYLGLIYDEYRKVFYRITKHAQKLKKGNHRLNSRYDGNWSIIILDEHLKNIGEVKMPPNTKQICNLKIILMKNYFVIILICLISCKNKDIEVLSVPIINPYQYVEDLNYYLDVNFRLQLSSIKKDKLFIIPISSCTPCVDDILNSLTTESCESCAIIFVGENHDNLRQVKIDQIKQSTKTYFDKSGDLYNYQTNIGKPSVLFINQNNVDFMILDIKDKQKTRKTLGWE